MSQNPPFITVLLSLSSPLDSEAYAARIDQRIGWRSCQVAQDDQWHVRLADRCYGSLGGTIPPKPVVVLIRPDEAGCTCCRSLSRQTTWENLLTTLSEAAGQRPPTGPTNDLLDTLTRRETQVLGLVGQGKSVAECAETLGVSPSTIGNHKYRLMRKLGVSTSLQLLRIAVRAGLADLH